MRRAMGLCSNAAWPVAALAVASAPAPALAQAARTAPDVVPPTQAAVVSSDAQKDATTGIGDIVVTAQKRGERAQDVGIAIEAYGADALKAQGVTQLVDLPRISPGVNITGSYAGQNLSFVIRGVQQQDFAAIAEGPNAVYIDEGYVGISNDSSIGLFDVDSVQVYKGPQGTLFGRNATGGVVSIATRNPSSEQSGFAELTYGSYNTRRVEAALGGPLGDDLSARIAVLYDANDAWVRNSDPAGGDLGAHSDFGVRGKLRWRPREGVELLATVFATRSVASWGPYFRVDVVPAFSGGAVPAATATTADTGFGPVSDPRGLTLDSHDAQSHGDFQEMQGADLKASWQFGGWQVTSITDFKHFRDSLNLDDIVAPAFLIDTHDRDHFESWSEELRLFRAWTGLRWTSGLYALHMDNHLFDDQDYRGIGLNDVVSDAHLRTTAFAIFTQAEWDVASKWTLVGGVRFTTDGKRYSYVATDPFAPAVVRNFPTSGGTARLTDGLVTAKAEVEFKPSRDALLYVSWNRGAKAGSFNDPQHAASPPVDAQIPYRPEELDAYEAGLKVQGWHGRVHLNADAFFYHYRDAQTYVFLLPLNSLILNAPERTVGTEVEGALVPVRGVTLSAGGSYTRARVLDVDINGNPPRDLDAPLTPRLRATMSARYEFAAGPGRLALQADAQYQSRSFIGLANYEADRINPYWLAGAQVSWRDAADRWTVAVTGANLLDTRYKTVGFDVATLGIEQFAVGQPRWIKASVSRRF